MNPVNTALKFYGMSAVSPQIVALIHAEFDPNFNLGTEAWCAAFLNAILKACGLQTSGSAAAMSFTNVGQSTNVPQFGDIVIFWRGTAESGLGHVGLFIRQDTAGIWVLGGNEDGVVEIKPEPANQLIGYRVVEEI